MFLEPDTARGRGQRIKSLLLPAALLIVGLSPKPRRQRTDKRDVANNRSHRLAFRKGRQDGGQPRLI
jgi:hypothetical protein